MTPAVEREPSMREGQLESWSREFGAELERHVTAMLGNEDEARDVIQDLWLTALRAPPDSGGGSNVRAWMYRVATRRALDALSSRRRRRELLSARAGELMPAGPAAPDKLFTRLSAAATEQIRSRIAALPNKQRSAVWLRWIEGRDYETIGELIGATPESARANVYQGLKKLRRELAHIWREEVIQ